MVFLIINHYAFNFLSLHTHTWERPHHIYVDDIWNVFTYSQMFTFAFLKLACNYMYLTLYIPYIITLNRMHATIY